MAGAYGAAAVLLLLSACSGDDDDDDAQPVATSTTTTSTTAPPSYEPVVETVACDGEVPAEPRVECGVLTVPVDRADPDAGDVTIPYAVLGTDDPNPQPDPIIYFSGGPGGAGRQIADFLLEIGIAGGARDVIVFDQRGTGASTPSLECPEYTDAVWAILGAAAPPIDEIAIAEDAYADCRDRLVAEGVDLDAYDTPTTAADVEDLRIALGIDEWNLFGVSYGTTVALEVVRRHPESVRSAVFDSVYPPDQPSDGAEAVRHAERALDALFAGCAADEACAAAHGDVEATVQALVDAWNADPHEAAVEDPVDGQQRQLVITGDDVVAGLWNAMYDDALIGLLPSLPAALLAGDPITDVVVQQLATDGVEQLTSVAEGVASGVDCADRQRIAGASDIEVMASQPFYAALIAFNSRACDVWDVEPVAAEFNEPVRSDVPSLFLAGEYDPVTPPADTEAASSRFADATYVEFPGLGHSAVFSDRCPTSVMLAFVDDPGAAVDIACVATMGPPAWTV